VTGFRAAVDFFLVLDFLVAADFASTAFEAGVVLLGATVDFPGSAFEVGGAVEFFLGAVVTPLVGVESAAANRSTAADRNERMFIQCPLRNKFDSRKGQRGRWPDRPGGLSYIY
jgi:hypothetical protein